MNKQRQQFLSVIGKNTGKTKEDIEIEKTLNKSQEETECPYHLCDGHGMIRRKNDDGAPYVEFCKCYIDSVLKQKLKNANIPLEYMDNDFNFDDGKTIAYILKPKVLVDELKIKKKNQSLQEALIEEDPNHFVDRHFSIKKEERKTNEIFYSFAEKNYNLIGSNRKPLNLLLFGDSGNGKTSFACLIASYFLKKNKKVYFSITEDFLNAIYDNKTDTREIAKKYDVLILDEFFAEYHTNSKWAKTKLKEILKIRDELNLITICTSNGNPKEFSLLYGEAIMSMLKGTFFHFYLERQGDGRVEKMQSHFEDFGF